MADTITTVDNATSFTLAPRSLGEAMQLAKILADSDLVPKEYRGKPGNVLVAVQMGQELGLQPMQSLQNIAVINGRPCLWGDALLAVVQSHRDYVDLVESDDGETATAIAKRRGRSDKTATFSMADARTAGLAGGNVWKTYPKRMRQMRARAFAIRDQWADALRGMQSAEEQRDIVQARVVEQPKETQRPSPTPPALANKPKETAPEDFRVRAGQFQGQRIGDLPYERVMSWAGAAQDPLLRAACQAVVEARLRAEQVAAEDDIRDTTITTTGEQVNPETGEVLS